MSLGLLLYRLAWWLGWPMVALVTWLHPRTRVRWRERWTLTLPAVPPGTVVVHGASVGEGQAAAGVLDVLASQQPRRVLLRSATADTGLAVARGHDALCALPMDAPFAVRRFLDHVRPRALVLVEAEIWPNLLLAARSRGVVVVVVGARIGRGTQRWLALPRTWGVLEGCVAHWFAKSETTAEALRGHVTGPVQVLGDPKVLAPTPASELVLPRPLVVGCSTRPGDEEALLAALPGGATLLLAPRHPERFDEVAALVIAARRPLWRRSDGAAPTPGAVILLDTLGELSGVLAQADAAFIGGTFDPQIGGHSPIEAARAGAAVVHGPHTWSNDEAWPGLATHRCSTVTDLADALQAALVARPGRQAVSDRAGWAEALRPLLEGPVPVERAARPWLLPVAWLFEHAAAWRIRRLGAGARAALPVVSVGNVASGGTGKTPVVAWWLEALAARGLRPAVVSRGYGRVDGPAVREVSTAEDGDELAMLARRGFLAISAPDRLAGAAHARQAGADVVVLDDAFQHRRIARDLDVVVVDGHRPHAGGPLPAGEAREGPAALARADVLWVQNGPLPAGLPDRPTVRGHHVPVGWWDGHNLSPLDSVRGDVVAFAGIANPGRFLEQLVVLGLRVRTWTTFRDHHVYNTGDLQRLGALGLPLVTTEKDLIRLPDGTARALRVRCEILDGQDLADALVDRVAALCS